MQLNGFSRPFFSRFIPQFVFSQFSSGILHFHYPGRLVRLCIGVYRFLRIFTAFLSSLLPSLFLLSSLLSSPASFTSFILVVLSLYAYSNAVYHFLYIFTAFLSSSLPFLFSLSCFLSSLVSFTSFILPVMSSCAYYSVYHFFLIFTAFLSSFLPFLFPLSPLRSSSLVSFTSFILVVMPLCAYSSVSFLSHIHRHSRPFSPLFVKLLL